MRTESVTTHDLRPGDVVLTHGALFELTAVTWFSCKFLKRGREVLPYELQDLKIEELNGATVSCETRLLNDGGSIPRSWLKDWRIQGNRAARWSRVLP